MELLITAGQLLTGPRGERVEDGAVLLRGERIVGAGKRPDVEPLASTAAERLDCPGSTVLPGLIDCHVHLAFDGRPDPAATLAGLDDDSLLRDMATRARQLLDCGVTTVRDLGDRRGLVLRLRDAIAAGHRPGPRILAAGAPLTVPGGHCWFLGGEVEGESALREMVRDHAERGADLIKVMATGGHLTPSGPSMMESQFTAAELRTIVTEAHGLGLPVAAHAHGTAGITDAVGAGVDTVEHCTWLGPNGFDVPPATVAALVAGGIHVCPAISRNWRDFDQRFGAEIASALLTRVRWLDEQGVRLVAGTDAGIPGATVEDYVDALHVFRHVGFARDRIVEMATADAAEALGLAGTTGRLGPGLRADVLVVDGDPLTDLDALRRVRLVLAGGRAHTPAR
jgi:imidazolonepropionase-like amidohydrolase